jgi:hypothetical protein
MVMRKIDEIIIHCTATRPNWWEDKTTEEKVAEVKRWHVQDNGWSDLGYHYLIDRDGTVAKGRPVEKAGAHCKGHNSTTIGVSLFGGHGSSERDTFNEHFTVEQNKALRELLADLSDTYGIKKISGHNRYSAKACPGFNVPRWLARKPAAPERTKAVQSKTIQASATQMATGAGGAVAALAALDGTAQLVAIGGSLAFLAAVFGIYKAGARAGVDRMRQKIDQRRLDNFATAKEVSNEVEILDDTGLSDRASKWLRNDD